MNPILTEVISQFSVKIQQFRMPRCIENGDVHVPQAPKKKKDRDRGDNIFLIPAFRQRRTNIKACSLADKE